MFGTSKESREKSAEDKNTQEEPTQVRHYLSHVGAPMARPVGVTLAGCPENWRCILWQGAFTSIVKDDTHLGA